MKPTLVIPDLHAPYNHPQALDFLQSVKEAYDLDNAVCLGDEADYHAMSFHDSDPALLSAGDELKAARKFLQKLHKLCPAMKICESNHGSMRARKALAHGLPGELFKDYADLYGTPGWTWHREIIDEIAGIPIVFRHAFGKNTRSALRNTGGACIVQGHFHSNAEITWLETPRHRIFGMSCGCLINPQSPAFAYNTHDLARPILGCGVIIDGLPMFLPMWLKRNRWTGEVP